MIIEKNKNKKTNPFNFISIFLLISRVHEINVLYQNKKDFDGEDTATDFPRDGSVHLWMKKPKTPCCHFFRDKRVVLGIVFFKYILK
jgi:hypothetical protein